MRGGGGGGVNFQSPVKFGLFSHNSDTIIVVSE